MDLDLVYWHSIFLSMAKRFNLKLHYLEHRLHVGVLVDAAWLSKHGYSPSPRSQYAPPVGCYNPNAKSTSGRGIPCPQALTVLGDEGLLAREPFLNQAFHIDASSVVFIAPSSSKPTQRNGA